jgi:hypothetical protein
MGLVIDVFFNLASHLPKLISGRLYSPERTKRNVEVIVSAQEGSVEVWCNKYQSKFRVILDFRNNNPFPIEIDRVEISGYLHSASMKAIELFGAKIEAHKKVIFFLEGKIDAANLEQINQAPKDETLRLEVKTIIVNKYHNIRDYIHHFERLVCKYYNRQ